MKRESISVVLELLREKRRIVRDYPESVLDTGDTIDSLIDGTAAFPGGMGLWRGSNPWGSIPNLFPESPIMFVGHNFDSHSGYRKSKERGCELQSPKNYWGILHSCLKEAGIAPEECFFTNVLMGLKPGSATGPMPFSKLFEAQCLEFLSKQILIVRPRLIVSLGGDASRRVRKISTVVARHYAMHPSARQFNPLATRNFYISEQASALKNACYAVKSG